MYFKLYKDGSVKKEWRWTLHAGNHEPIANSGEGYVNKSDCLHAIDLVKGSQDALVEEG